MSRRLAAIVSGAVLVALAVPVTWDYGEDGFPLSGYPMFSRGRGRRASIPSVIAVDAEGGRHLLSPEQIGGTPWVNLAARRVLDATRGGGSAALCRDVAVRVVDEQAVALEVVTETFDTLDYIAGQTTPTKRRVHAQCTVPR